MSNFLRRGSTPLFLRIFGVMLLTVLLVQALNFVVVLLTPPPQPPLTSVTDIVSRLQGRAATDDKLIVRDGAIDPRTPVNERDVALRRLIASRMGLDESAVRVQSRWPGLGLGGLRLRPPWPKAPLGMLTNAPPTGEAPPAMGPPPMGPNRPPFAADWESHGELALIGDFAVSAQMGGKWRTVELRAGTFQPRRRGALMWLTILLIVVAPLAWLLARRLARPIGLFAEAANRLGRNPRSEPLALTGPPEIQDAAHAFNEMQTRLNRYVENRTTLMAAIAHDLRTPLMRLNLRLEHAPAAMRQDCEADIAEMEHMIASVMAFVRDMNRVTRRQRLDLRSLAESVTDGFVDRGAAVTLEEGNPLILEGDAPALKSLLSNLVDNAVKYAGHAHVALGQGGAGAVIEVSDHGPGMSEADLDHAFEPFFRAERSRAKDMGGIGLGLASVRAVARAHGGEATLANRPDGGGLVARVTLPL